MLFKHTWKEHLQRLIMCYLRKQVSAIPKSTSQTTFFDYSALKLKLSMVSNLLYVWKLKNKLNILQKIHGYKKRKNPNGNYQLLELNNQSTQKTPPPLHIKTCAVKLKWYLEGNA